MGALFDNMTTANLERQRRNARMADDPEGFAQSFVNATPGWDAFFGKLHDYEDAGYNVRARFNPSDDGPDWMDPRMRGYLPGDNQALNEIGNSQRVRAQIDDERQRQMLDQRQRQLIADQEQSYNQQVSDSLNAPPIDQRPIAQTTQPNGTVKYSQAAEPLTREAILNRVPLPLRAQYEKQFSDQDIARAKAAAEIAKLTKGASEPLVAVIGPDGKSVLVPRSEAAGKRPANAREQGRPVTSGDAGKIADLDASLNDLGVLQQTITGNHATGTSAKVGAMLPNAVTDLTGLGTEAKQKQAVIDRVKQVIGKALEGGVLRKEDENKYEKILPTIGDAPAVVKTKLEGLQRAIEQRKQIQLDALDDAGYDVGRYRERTPPTTKPVDPLGIR